MVQGGYYKLYGDDFKLYGDYYMVCGGYCICWVGSYKLNGDGDRFCDGDFKTSVGLWATEVLKFRGLATYCET